MPRREVVAFVQADKMHTRFIRHGHNFRRNQSMLFWQSPFLPVSQSVRQSPSIILPVKEILHTCVHRYGVVVVGNLLDKWFLVWMPSECSIVLYHPYSHPHTRPDRHRRKLVVPSPPTLTVWLVCCSFFSSARTGIRNFSSAAETRGAICWSRCEKWRSNRSPDQPEGICWQNRRGEPFFS